MEQPAVHPIIIVRKKHGRAAHHGGAWKVAYADFVTAMMALFIVLWLLSSSQETQKAVGGYFTDPNGKGKDVGTGLHGTGNTVNLRKDDMPKLKEHLEEALKKMPEFQTLKSQIKLIVTGEGLRIELIESEAGTFFESGRADPTQKCRDILAMLAEQLGDLPNKLLIEGHTDSRPFSSTGSYTNWELSADRANAARRVMEGDGIKDSQIAQVRGFADQNLRVPNDPENAANRRVSVIVQYMAGVSPLADPKHTQPTGPAAGANALPAAKPSPTGRPATPDQKGASTPPVSRSK